MTEPITSARSTRFAIERRDCGAKLTFILGAGTTVHVDFGHEEIHACEDRQLTITRIRREPKARPRGDHLPGVLCIPCLGPIRRRQEKITRFNYEHTIDAGQEIQECPAEPRPRPLEDVREPSVEGPEMPALVTAVATQNLSQIRDRLIAVAAAYGNSSPVLTSKCTMVCAMWAGIICSQGTSTDDAASIASCMLHDALTVPTTA